MIARHHQVLSRLRGFLRATRAKGYSDDEANAILRAYQLGTFGTVRDWECECG